MKKLFMLTVAVLATITISARTFAHNENEHDCSLEENQERYTCKRCDGSKVEPMTFTCSACNGKKITTNLRDCSRCNGKGTIKDKYGDDEKCPECDGARKIIDKQTCSKCNGSGEETRPCRECGGKGYVDK